MEPAYFVAAISEENGLEGINLFPECFNSERFKTIFPMIAEHGTECLLVMDGVRYHFAPPAQEELAKHKPMTYVKNVSYSPFLNAIELYFNELKLRFRQLRTDTIMNNKLNLPEELVFEASESVKKESI